MIGRTISHYKITGKLGEGGMGVVYKAEDTQLERTVALKFLAAHLLRDEEARKRFHREAKAAASLHHPNVCPVYEIAEAEGQTFIAMAFIEGESLDKRVEQGPLKIPEALDIAQQIAQGLEAAHEKKIVHRDIKPGNVIVDDKGHVTVMDFGLALLTEGSKLTQLDTTVGTAAYMSPEQIQGLEVDHRTDIWALGCVLYEMVCGQRPFKGLYDQALLYEIVHEDHEPLTGVRTGVPIELEFLVNKCLAKDTANRYQSAGEMIVDLRNLGEKLKSGQSKVLSAPAQAADPAAPLKRAPAVNRWIAAGVLGLVTFGFAGYLLWRGLAPSGEGAKVTPASREAVSAQKMIVVLPFENLGAAEDEYFADGITEEIISRLAAVDSLGVISRTSAMQYKHTRPSLRQIGEELGVDYVLEGTVRWQRSGSGTSQVRVTPQLIRVSEDIHLWSGRYDAELTDIFEVQSDIAKEVIEKLDVALLEPQRRSLEFRPTENPEAYDAYLRGNDYLHRGREVHSPGDFHFAIQMYEQAQELDPTFALSHARQSVAHAWLYVQSFDRTESRLALAKEAADRALRLDPTLPEAHHALGLYFFGQRDWDRALEEYQIALKSQPGNIEVFKQISSVQVALGAWEEARTTLGTAMNLNPRLGSLACWAGGCSLALRDFSKAIRSHDRAIQLIPDRSCPYYCKALIYLNWDGGAERTDKFLGRLPPNVDLEGNPPINYPWVMADLIEGRYQEALRRLSSGSSKVYEFHSFYIPKDLLAAQIHGLMNRPEFEQAHYEAARELLEATIEDQPKNPNAHSSLGIAYAGLGRRHDAIREGKLGLELLAGDLGEPLGFRLKELAQIYVMLGDYDDAVNHLDHLLSVPAHFSAGFLKADPTWNALRGHPRFLALLEKHSASAVPGSPVP